MVLEKKLHKNTTSYLTCKDYTTSGESFELLYNKSFDVLVTAPIPENLDRYYQSENYISHTDSKKTVIDKAYQFVKNITLQRKLKLINSFGFENKTILDVGAGTADFLAVCKKNSWNVVGVEPNVDAKKIASTKGIDLLDSLVKIPNQQFSVITLWHVLEHVNDLETYIHQLKELLTNDGKLIIAVPNYKSYDANYYKQFWAAFDVPRHLWHFSKKGIKTIFSNYEIKLEKTFPMKFDSYYVSILSEKYKRGKSNLIKGVYRGFISNSKARKSGEYSSLLYVLSKNNKN